MEEAIAALDWKPRIHRVKIIHEGDDASLEERKANELRRLAAAGVDPSTVRFWIRRIHEPTGIPVDDGDAA